MISIDRPFEAERVSLKLPGAVRLRVRRSESGSTISIRSEDADPQQLSITERDGKLRIKTEDRCARRAEYDVVIDAATALGLRVAAPKLELHAELDLGSVDLAAATVAVDLDRVTELKMAAKSGHARISEVAGERAFIAAASADVLIERCYASLDTRMGTGDLQVGVLDGPLTARSATGDIESAWTGADVEVRSGSGAVSLGVLGDIATWLDLYSGTGHIDVDVPPSEPPADGEPYVAISVATGTGDIRIYRAESDDADGERTGEPSTVAADSTDSSHTTGDTTVVTENDGATESNKEGDDDDATGTQ